MHKTMVAGAVLILALAASGCATGKPELSSRTPIPSPAATSARLRTPSASPGSLFTQQRSDIYTDLRGRHVGDIIIVEITENAKAKKKADSKAERTNEYEAGIPYLLGYANRLRLGANSAQKDALTGKPLVQATFSSKHDATSELSKEDTMTASIGCTVVEVLPNGNMLVRGSREIEVNGETQYIILQGTVRPADVSTRNTVLSTQLADARIAYTGRGVLSDKQKPGWLARLLDHIWPF